MAYHEMSKPVRTKIKKTNLKSVTKMSHFKFKKVNSVIRGFYIILMREYVK